MVLKKQLSYATMNYEIAAHLGPQKAKALPMLHAL